LVVVLIQLAPARAATCASSVGPGIPPPAQLPSGLVGFHAAWYGQSGYMSLCAGTTATATVAFYNSGSRGWVAGRMGEAAYLGTSDPEPGQDRASVLGGDGTNGSPATAWTRFNRPAVQPVAYVGPNQIAWFQFAVRAPDAPGGLGRPAVLCGPLGHRARRRPRAERRRSRVRPHIRDEDRARVPRHLRPLVDALS